MKSVIVAPRSGFLIKDGSKHHLISISFNSLLLALCLIAPFGKNKSSGTAQSSWDKKFCRSTSHSLLTDSKQSREQVYVSLQSNCFIIILTKNRLVTTGIYFQIQLPEAVSWRCSVKKVFPKILQYWQESICVGDSF